MGHETNESAEVTVGVLEESRKLIGPDLNELEGVGKINPREEPWTAGAVDPRP